MVIMLYHGRPVTSHFRKACRRAGVYALTFHGLRHTFGTRSVTGM